MIAQNISEVYTGAKVPGPTYFPVGRHRLPDRTESAGILCRTSLADQLAPAVPRYFFIHTVADWTSTWDTRAKTKYTAIPPAIEIAGFLAGGSMKSGDSAHPSDDRTGALLEFLHHCMLLHDPWECRV